MLFEIVWVRDHSPLTKYISARATIGNTTAVAPSATTTTSNPPLVFIFAGWGLACGFVAWKRRRFGMRGILVLVTGYAALLAIFAESLRRLWALWSNS
jgi:hypothetical protein